MNQKVVEAIKKAAKEQNIQTNIWEQNVNASLRDIGIDSLSAMGLIVKVEEILGVRIPDEELVSLKTIKSLIDAFEKQLSA